MDSELLKTLGKRFTPLACNPNPVPDRLISKRFTLICNGITYSVAFRLFFTFYCYFLLLLFIVSFLPKSRIIETIQNFGKKPILPERAPAYLTIKYGYGYFTQDRITSCSSPAGDGYRARIFLDYPTC